MIEEVFKIAKEKQRVIEKADKEKTLEFLVLKAPPQGIQTGQRG